MSVITQAIDLSIEQTIAPPKPLASVAGVPLIAGTWANVAGVPAYWSFARDRYLRNMWKEGDHLSIAMYTAQSILVNIPMRVEARDPNVIAHVQMAEHIDKILFHASEFGGTLTLAKQKFVEDLLSTDNGAFLEIIGNGAPDGPIEGLPLAVRHLDSQFCWRTGDPVYPVVYHDPYDHKAYKLHRSRVIAMSQMPSADHRLNGVGFCAVSRAMLVGQHLIDIYIHKQEKLGSRPLSAILLGKGIPAEHIMTAVGLAQRAMDRAGLRRYGKIVAVGSEDTSADLKAIDLTSFDPFDEQTSVTLAMYAVAGAFGLPIQEIWPTSTARQSSDNQEARQRGKLPAEFNEQLGSELEQKFLPSFLKMTADWRDDYQDERRAINQDIRARNRERDLGSGSITVRTSRERMLEVGDATQDQFRRMELESGRLEDGLPVTVLFYSSKKPYSVVMPIPGVPSPTDINANDPQMMLRALSKKQALIHNLLATAKNRREQWRYMQCLAAVELLVKQYQGVMDTEMLEVPQGREETSSREPDQVRMGTLVSQPTS